MRGEAPQVGVPYTVGELLPPPLQEDPLAMAVTAGLDDVLAPAIASLDCLESYVDPDLAPPDFLEWLAGWVGAVLDENWPVSRRRWSVARALELFRLRGTVAGLRDHISLASGCDVEIVDSGGVSWSNSPDAPPPGSADAHVTVRLMTCGGDVPDIRVVEELVASAKPAHLRHTIELVER